MSADLTTMTIGTILDERARRDAVHIARQGLQREQGRAFRG
jgi:hypothetical protein